MRQSVPILVFIVAIVVGAQASICFGAVKEARETVDKAAATFERFAADPDAATARVPGLDRIEWVRGDAMNETEAVAAAAGAQLIVHAANPPGYKNWRGLALPMLATAIAVAKAVNARLVFPGNVYNFGPDAWPLVDERRPRRHLPARAPSGLRWRHSWRGRPSRGCGF